MVRALRRDLAGWLRLPGGGRARFEDGVPREVAQDAACSDPGRGGHTCAAACIGDLDLTALVDVARRAAGFEMLTASETRCRDHPSDPWIAEAWATLSVPPPPEP